MIDSSAKELKVSPEIADKNLKKTRRNSEADEIITKRKSKMFSSEQIQNVVLNITSEYLYSEYHFDRKSQVKISPSDQSLEKKNKNW